MMRRARRSCTRTLCSLPLLPLNFEQQFPPTLLYVLIAQRRQAEALVLFGVFLVADANQRGLEQPHDGCQHRTAGERLAPHVAFDLLADRRQRAAEFLHALELDFVSRRVPVGMIAVLLASARVSSGRLQVPPRIGARSRRM